MWEKNLQKSEYLYSWYTLLYNRNKCNIVNQLYYEIFKNV